MENTEDSVSGAVSTAENRHPRLLSFLYLVAVLIVSVFLISLRFHSETPHLTTYITCSTPDCNLYAQLLSRSLDTSLSPCDDFYSYVCGGGRKRSSLPTNSILAKLWSRTRQALINRISTAGVPRVNQSANQKAMKLLQSCLSVERDALTYSEPLKRFLSGIDFPWPQASDLNAIDLLVEVSLNWGLPTWISLRRNNFIQDKTGRPVIELADNPHVESWFRRRAVMKKSEQYDEFLSRHVAALGTEGQQLRQVVGTINQVEQHVEDVILRPNSHMPSDDSLKFASFPGGDTLLKALNSRTPCIGRDYSMNDTIRVLNRKLFNAVFEALARSQNDSALGRLLSAGIGWLAVESLGRFASIDLASLQHLGRSAQEYDYEADCLYEVTDKMGLALALLTFGKLRTPNVVKEIAGIAERTFSSLNRTVMKSRVLNDFARRVAGRILAKMHNTLFFPWPSHFEDEVNKIFSALPDLIHLSFIDNWVDAMRGLVKGSAGIPPTLPLFPALLFQEERGTEGNILNTASSSTYFPFYSTQLVPAVNYGGLGYGIGKSIAEALNWERTAWLKETPLETYTTRLQCLRNEFAGHKSRTIDVDPDRDIVPTWDMMAAHWSLSSVYRAFKDGAAGRDSRLAGAPQFSDDQLFFLSACYNLCSTDDAVVAALLCNVPLKNIDEFGRSFQCRTGSLMNPNEKCDSW